MIEALIEYIRAKGFRTHVFPGRVLLYKDSNGKRCTVSWGIHRLELEHLPKECLFDKADYWMQQIDTAIEEEERKKSERDKETY